MGAGTSTPSVLASLSTELSTRIATAIDDLQADGAPSSLVDPVTVEVVDDIAAPLLLSTRPHVAIMIEGGVDRVELGTPQRYLLAPLLVAVTLTAAAHLPTTAFADALWYGRAVEMALTRVRNGVITGLFNINDIDTAVDLVTDGDRMARRAMVRAVLHITETRAQ